MVIILSLLWLYIAPTIPTPTSSPPIAISASTRAAIDIRRSDSAPPGEVDSRRTRADAAAAAAARSSSSSGTLEAFVSKLWSIFKNDALDPCLGIKKDGWS